MKTIKITTMANFEFNSKCCEKMSGPSQTIQNDSYSIADLVRKGVNGTKTDAFRQTYYGEDQDFDDLDHNQFQQQEWTEKQNILQENRDKIAELQQLKKLKESKQKDETPIATKRSEAEPKAEGVEANSEAPSPS